MCLIAFALDAHDEYRLLLAANRDEYYVRTTSAAAWWSDRPDVYGGRDGRAGGSWLAIDRGGRVAAVTNVREPDPAPARHSRGRLVGDFVGGTMSPREYADAVLGHAAEYAGFNLLLFDLASTQPALFVSNRNAGGTIELDAGVHGLSNGSLDATWPKVRHLCAALDEAMLQDDASLEATLLRALADRRRPGDEELPDTGVGIERERALASAMIAEPQWEYGTRASTVLAVRRDGRVAMMERSWAAGGATPRLAGDRRVRFRLAPHACAAFTREEANASS